MKKPTIERLIECPFCESNNVSEMAIVRFDLDGKQYNKWYVYCKDCGAKCGEETTKENAIARWNRDFDYFKDVEDNDVIYHLETVRYIAFHTQAKDGGTESQVDFEAKNIEEARMYVENHLDLSFEWTIKEL